MEKYEPLSNQQTPGEATETSDEHRSFKRFRSVTNATRPWLILAGWVVVIIGLVTLTTGQLYRQSHSFYQLILIIGLVSYLPLSYLAYLQFQAQTHKRRVKDDFELLGITMAEEELDDAHARIYGPRQFIIYVTLAVLVTILGFGITHFEADLAFIPIQIHPKVATTMFFSFFGAYTFSLFYIYRRYVTLDLQPNVYLYITARIVTVQAVAFVLALFLQTLAENTNYGDALIPIVAFVVGYLPDTGIRWLLLLTQRFSNKLKFMQRSELLLSKIEGISLWHETRLRESGIDNAQNLAAADVRELLLNSRFSAQQLMHWIDQALLKVNLPEKTTNALCGHGICTISALRLFLEKMQIVELDEWERRWVTAGSKDGSEQAKEGNASESTSDNSSKQLWNLDTNDLLAAYYSATTGPNLHYVTEYWRAVQRYRSRMVQRSLERLLHKQTEEVAQTFTDVLSEKLDERIDSMGIDPHDLELIFQSSSQLAGLGLVYLQREQYEEAVRVLTKAISVDKRNADAYSSRGLAWAKQKNFDQAFADFTVAKALNQALNSEVKNAITFNREGTVYLLQGNKPRAIEAYGQAIALNPEYATPYFNRGIIYSEQEAYQQEAIQDFGQAIKYEPERIQAYIRRGMLYLGTEKYRLALRDFAGAIRLNRNSAQAYNGRGTAYLNLEDYPRAIFDFDTAIEIDPNRPEFYLNRAEARSELNDLGGVIADCTHALFLDDMLGQAYETRALAYVDATLIREAIADFKRYLEFVSGDIKFRVEAYIEQLKPMLNESQPSLQPSDAGNGSDL